MMISALEFPQKAVKWQKKRLEAFREGRARGAVREPMIIGNTFADFQGDGGFQVIPGKQGKKIFKSLLTTSPLCFILQCLVGCKLIILKKYSALEVTRNFQDEVSGKHL